ncbi:hypothetical protein I6J77_10790 [Rhodanobacter sp. FDAARGOS 1247]|uniref:hypothetical protein n=1 Tax=Rhodanobacter sp. FDAARGOS 1247 TaxID=2778082 RepID=UPI00194DFB50|nr:hypothetical protein [Rhodanobacter sp. FDAARGOS 1247]QRP62625.1 hypothetical protein I6J77_10790 [Rhodanobacter sp. FDAARGOS 1247]
MSEDQEQTNTSAPLLAAGRLLSALPKIASGVLGITAIAYVVGWRMSAAYYSELGARWAFDLMSIAQVARSAAWVVSLTAVLSAGCVMHFIAGHSTAKRLGRWAVFWMLSGCITWVLSDPPWGLLKTSWAHGFTFLTGLFWAIATGVSVGELTAILASGRRFEGYMPYLYDGIVVYGLIFAPGFIGQASAEFQGASASHLPLVTVLATSDSRPWRLVGPVGDQLLLILPSDDKAKRLFKLVSPTSLAFIESTEAHGVEAGNRPAPVARK